MKVIVWPGFDFDLIGTYQGHLLGFKKLPRIEEVPIRTDAGPLIMPGDILQYIGGKKTSAGFHIIDMIEPYGFQFLGTHTGLDGRFCLFLQTEGDGSPKKTEPHPDYKFMPWAYRMSRDFNCWFFATPAIAGRVVETEKIIFKH